MWRLQAEEELIDGQDNFSASYISFHWISRCSASLSPVFLCRNNLPPFSHAMLTSGRDNSPWSPLDLFFF